MSRLDPRVAEQNRVAYLRDIEDKKAWDIANKKACEVAAWLKENSHIGVLNGGTYYKIVNDEKVNVELYGQ
jgi:hypothetical protein|tara:strand:+ start:133 stop:345 length:213 start_codon:yes stop_codon:yes gene_type:complete